MAKIMRCGTTGQGELVWTRQAEPSRGWGATKAETGTEGCTDFEVCSTHWRPRFVGWQPLCSVEYYKKNPVTSGVLEYSNQTDHHKPSNTQDFQSCSLALPALTMFFSAAVVATIALLSGQALAQDTINGTTCVPEHFYCGGTLLSGSGASAFLLRTPVNLSAHC